MLLKKLPDWQLGGCTCTPCTPPGYAYAAGSRARRAADGSPVLHRSLSASCTPPTQVPRAENWVDVQDVAEVHFSVGLGDLVIYRS
jgi:hypothetical protein